MTFAHGEDITNLLLTNPSLTIDAGKKDKEPTITQTAQSTPAAPVEEPQGDHPIILLVDLAVTLTGTFAKSAGIEPPNEELYRGMARGATNETLWKLAPNLGEGEEDSPVLLVVFTALSLGVVFLPTAAGAVKQYKEKQRREQEEAAPPELPPYQPAEIPPMPAHLPKPEPQEEPAAPVDEDDPAYRISLIPSCTGHAGFSGL